jgi:hypothetical protein
MSPKGGGKTLIDSKGNVEGLEASRELSCNRVSDDKNCVDSTIEKIPAIRKFIMMTIPMTILLKLREVCIAPQIIGLTT